MDGIHDLGGREGFGKIDVGETEEQFHQDWEARTFGLVRAMSRANDWSIDWFRHCRELIGPVDYLSRPYYDQWLQTYAAMMVNSGIATVAELADGKVRTPVPDLRPPMKAADVAGSKRVGGPFEREATAVPLFAAGDTVTTVGKGISGHTRLPSYARGRHGVIAQYHGAHVFPDANAVGDKRAEPLYTVEFNAADLWPEAEGRRDSVLLNLWESYFERP
jgi:nitrile hydratase beta subunit